MSEVADAPAAFAERLRAVLEDGLARVGIDARVEVQPIPATLLHRALVVTPQFGSLEYSDRQEVVWRMVSRVLTEDEKLYVGSIWTMTPDEMEGSA